MNPVLDLARPEILALQPYSHARWDPSLERMHANEMPWRAQGDNTLAGLNRYPEPQPLALLERLAELYAQPVERLLVGRGSDEAIDLLARAFCAAGRDAVLTCPPTFGYYAVAARIQGAEVIEVPLQGADFALDVDGVIAAGRRAKLLFLCSPNNPTGNAFAAGDLLRVCRALEGHSIVVVDEAYLEFTARPSLATALDEHPNLAILRTLSKAYALAGARCGTLIGRPELIGLLRRIIPPYAMPAASVEESLRLTEAPQRAIAAERIRTLIAERERMRQRLSACAAVRRVWPSEANFLLVQCVAADAVLEAGRAVGLLVRDFSRVPRLEGCLRFSIGTPEQNERLLCAVEAL